MIGILGGGVWGSALAKLLSNQKVIIYARNKKIIKSINEHHFNPNLKYAVFNENITATDSLEEITNVDIPNCKKKKIIIQGNLSPTILLKGGKPLIEEVKKI